MRGKGIINHFYGKRKNYIIAWMYFIVGLVYLIPNIYQTSFMIDSGISASISGTVYAIAGMFSIVGAPVWGLISDRIGIKKALSIALLLAVIGDMIPIIFGNITGFIISAIIWGSSLGGILLLIQVAATKQVSPKYVSMAISFISVFYAVGQMIGPGLAGWIIGEIGYTAAYGLGTFGFFMCICMGLRLKRGDLANSAYIEK
jgi:MFS family permease